MLPYAETMMLRMCPYPADSCDWTDVMVMLAMPHRMMCRMSIIPSRRKKLKKGKTVSGTCAARRDTLVACMRLFLMFDCSRQSAGGMGKLRTVDEYEVWVCVRDHPCVDDENDMVCFTYNEKHNTFVPWRARVFSSVWMHMRAAHALGQGVGSSICQCVIMTHTYEHEEHGD